MNKILSEEEEGNQKKLWSNFINAVKNNKGLDGNGGFLLPIPVMEDMMEILYPGWKFQELMRKAIKKGENE
jgi:hypothetical protein